MQPSVPCRRTKASGRVTFPLQPESRRTTEPLLLRLTPLMTPRVWCSRLLMCCHTWDQPPTSHWYLHALTAPQTAATKPCKLILYSCCFYYSLRSFECTFIWLTILFFHANFLNLVLSFFHVLMMQLVELYCAFETSLCHYYCLIKSLIWKSLTVNWESLLCFTHFNMKLKVVFFSSMQRGRNTDTGKFTRDASFDAITWYVQSS